MNKKLFYSMLYGMTFLNLLMAAGVSCGAPRYKDNRLLTFIREFESIYAVSADSISAKLVDGDLMSNNPDVVGLCMPDTNNLLFRQEYWDMMTFTRKKIRVFHELAHCLMGRDHRDDVYPDGCPRSIMSTYLMDERCFDMHEGELLQELRFY